jgi:hypothetical protein
MASAYGAKDCSWSFLREDSEMTPFFLLLIAALFLVAGFVIGIFTGLNMRDEKAALEYERRLDEEKQKARAQTGNQITESAEIIGLKTKEAPEIATGEIQNAKRLMTGDDTHPRP